MNDKWHLLIHEMEHKLSSLPKTTLSAPHSINFSMNDSTPQAKKEELDNTIKKKRHQQFQRLYNETQQQNCLEIQDLDMLQ
jgi:hypothetical protein